MNELLQAFLDERGIKAPQDLKGHEEENKCSVGDKIIWVASRYIHITPEITEDDAIQMCSNSLEWRWRSWVN